MSQFAPYILTEVTPPVVPPVSLDDVKVGMDIDHDDHDSFITDLRDGVVLHLQEVWATQFINATYDAKYRCFPRSSSVAIHVPRRPLSSVVSIKYIDTSGTEQTWNASKYTVQAGSANTYGYIQPAFGETWPSTRGDDRDVTVQFVCGYGATAESVPQNVKQAIISKTASGYKGCDENMVMKSLSMAAQDLEFS